MRVAFVGKGGSGKTTMSALFARYVASQGAPVVAIDADINQHLALVLGVEEPPEPLGAHLTEIKDHLRGDNPRIPSAAAMVKTTPPGRGSKLLSFEELASYEHGVTTPEGVRLMATGPFNEDDLGVACYHSKVGAVELLLNHLIDGQGEYVVVDMTAGSDSFASGLFTRFDLTLLVVEPTRQGVGVYRQYRDYAADFQVPLAVVGNKVHDPSDVDFLREHVGHRPARLDGALRRRPRHGAGPPAHPRRPGARQRRHAVHAAQARGRAGEGLGPVRPPDGGVPPAQRARLGQRQDRRGPRRADRPRVRLRPLTTRLSPFSHLEGSPKPI